MKASVRGTTETNRTEGTASFKSLLSLSSLRVAAILLIALLTGCKRVPYEETIGHRGPALRNPFLAAERCLTELGHQPKRERGFEKRYEHQVIITAPTSFFNHGETEDLMAWVDNGGHLVVLIAGSESWRNDWGMDISELWKTLKQHADREPEEEKFLAEIGIENPNHWGTEKEETVTFPRREKLKANLRGTLDFKDKPPRKADITAGDKDTPALVSWPRHRGRITLVAHAMPFRNRYIGEHDHAAVIARIIAMGGQSLSVCFVDGARVSFWLMLWERAWMAIISLGLLLLFWLWKNTPRFGPMQPLPATGSRDFADHLLLTGAFIWRQRQSALLLQPLLNAVYSAATRAGWRDLGDEFCEWAAGRSGIPKARIAELLAAGEITDPQKFRLAVTALRRLHEAL